MVEEAQSRPAQEERVGVMKWLKKKAKQLKKEVLAMYYALHDPRCPWIAKVIPFIVLAYALSPLDLIPDFIPVLGIIDDLILLPALIWLAIWVIPTSVMDNARYRAHTEPLMLSKNWPMAVFIFLLWLGSLEWCAWFLCVRYGSENELVQKWMWPGMALMAVTCTAIFIVWIVHKVQKVRRKAEKFKKGLKKPLLSEQQGTDSAAGSGGESSAQASRV